MSFFAILFALLIEQARPLAASNPIHAGLRAWCVSVRRNFDAGTPRNAWIAWSAAVLVPALLVVGVHWWLLWGLGWPFAVLWFRGALPFIPKTPVGEAVGLSLLSVAPLAYWLMDIYKVSGGLP